MYVHVPFCARRCSYCDFSIAVRRTVPVEDFVRGVRAELAARALHRSVDARDEDVVAPVRSSAGASLVAETLYFGGGTPSRLGGDGVHALLDAVREHVALLPGAEVTLEVNPEDVTPAAADAWVRAGVNRVSLGVQSFQANVLTWMHRVHAAETSERAVLLLRDAGIADISVDLIFSVPQMLEREWSRDVDRALALQPTHISLYGLTVEAGTPLARWTARREVTEAPDALYASEFLHAHEALGAAGFDHYEVSNYGLPGHHARHNSAYWRGVPYLGLGPSAHGYDGTVRRWNARAYTEWLRLVSAGDDPRAGEERLSAEERETEAVYLGLRTQRGLVLQPGETALVGPWVAAGWLTVDANGVARCTPAGWLRLDALAAALTAHRSP